MRPASQPDSLGVDIEGKADGNFPAPRPRCGSQVRPGAYTRDLRLDLRRISLPNRWSLSRVAQCTDSSGKVDELSSSRAGVDQRSLAGKEALEVGQRDRARFTGQLDKLTHGTPLQERRGPLAIAQGHGVS